MDTGNCKNDANLLIASKKWKAKEDILHNFAQFDHGNKSKIEISYGWVLAQYR